MSPDFEPVDRRLLSHPAVRVRDLAGWDELLEDLSQTHLAIEWGPRNLEREIASTLRVVTYLWSGVPVITRPHLDLSKEIESYGAGWVVDRWEDLIELLARLAKDPGELHRCSQGAQKLAREHHTYSALADSFPAPLESLGKREKGPSFLDHMGGVLKVQEDLIQSRDQAIAALKEVICSREETIRARDRALGGLHGELEGLHRAIHDHQEMIAGLHQTIAGRDTAIHTLEREIGRLSQESGAVQSERASLIERVRANDQDAESYRAIRRKLVYRIWKRIVG